MDAFRRDVDPNGDVDIEAAEMETLMDDILHPTASCATSNRPCSKSNGPTAATVTAMSTAITSRQDQQDEEQVSGTVVGKAGKRGSYGRRKSVASAARTEGTGTKGIVERINENMRAIGPEIGRRRSTLRRQREAPGAATTTSTSVPSSRKTTQKIGSGQLAATEVSKSSKGARRATRTHTARGKEYPAAEDGHGHESDSESEVDEQERERGLSRWNLEFRDPILEKSFRGHYQSWVIPRVRLGVQIQMALNFLFGLLELGCGYSAGGVVAVLCLRLAIIVSLTAFLFISLDDRIHRIMDPLALGLYTMISVFLVAIDVVGSARGTASGSDGISLYFFFDGRWSLPSTLMFILVVYHISGLRYTYANIVAWMHYVFLWVAMLVGFCCARGLGSFFTQSAAIVPIFMVLSMISSNTVERQIRNDFVLRCNISSERARADEICTSMLPKHVSELLQNGSAVEDVLQEYPQITILFCYITGFKELTTSCDPYDVVDFVNSLFSDFDKCTEYHHVYKLEAIDCSYLCCAGGGQEGGDQPDSLAPPADRIWDMALTMLAVAAHGSKLPTPVGAAPSSSGGGGAVLKIGIHSGRVVGGVSGVKSFSYHLFGDTVNMASRTASTGLAGRVQLSKEAWAGLSPEKQLNTEIRRGVSMKGKGMVDTYLGKFDPDGVGLRMWRNFRRFEKMTKVYDPNFQQQSLKSAAKGRGKESKGEGASVEGKLEQIRVKKLKFSLKESGYENAQDALLSNELEAEYQHQYNASRLSHFQVFLLMALACVSASVCFDLCGVNIASTGTEKHVVLRVLVCLILAAVLAASREPGFVDWMQNAGAFVAAIFCLTLNALLLLVPEYHLMDMNIISLVTISLLMDLQYFYVLVVNALDVVLFTTAILVANSHRGEDVAGYLLFVYGAALVGSYACSKREREFRYAFLHKRILKDNKVKAEDLLKNMFPNVRHVAALVKGKRVVDHLEDVTIMFSDLKGYTQWASEESPREVYRVLNKVYTAFDRHLDALGVYKLDTIGDAFVVVAGLEGFGSQEEHAMAMVKYAFRMLFELERIKTEEDLNFEMRIGLHTGPSIGGVIGRLKPRYLCWGRTPLISNELEAAGTPGKLLVSATTFAKLNKQVLVTRGLKFRPSEPLHIKTCDGLADEEVPTFFIEMYEKEVMARRRRGLRTVAGIVQQHYLRTHFAIIMFNNVSRPRPVGNFPDSITAFTILANEIAEDRANDMLNSPRGLEEEGALMKKSSLTIESARMEPRRSKSSMMSVSRFKSMILGPRVQDGQDSQLFDFGGLQAGRIGGGVRGSRSSGGRRSDRGGSPGSPLATQSAYLASPPSSADSKATEVETQWDAYSDAAERHPSVARGRESRRSSSSGSLSNFARQGRSSSFQGSFQFSIKTIPGESVPSSPSNGNLTSVSAVVGSSESAEASSHPGRGSSSPEGLGNTEDKGVLGDVEVERGRPRRGDNGTVGKEKGWGDDTSGSSSDSDASSKEDATPRGDAGGSSGGSTCVRRSGMDHEIGGGEETGSLYGRGSRKHSGVRRRRERSTRSESIATGSAEGKDDEFTGWGDSGEDVALRSVEDTTSTFSEPSSPAVCSNKEVDSFAAGTRDSKLKEVPAADGRSVSPPCPPRVEDDETGVVSAGDQMGSKPRVEI